MNKDDVKPPNKKRMIVRFVMNAALILLLTTQYLNHTGFCYAEMKYLSDREIVDNFLFGDQKTKMSGQDKKKSVRENFNGADYPGCCYTTGDYAEKELKPDYYYAFQESFFGREMKKIFLFSPRDKSKAMPSSQVKPIDYPEYSYEEKPYEEEHIVVDQCGNKHLRFMGRAIGKSEYKDAVSHIEFIWRMK